MAYDVVKRVNGRAYLYRVESFRDPSTQKTRGKWTYVGRVPSDEVTDINRIRIKSKDRLLMALEEMLQTNGLSELTTGLVAAHAGISYGTFYRYFKSIDDIVSEAMLKYSAASHKLIDEIFVGVQSAVIERAKIALWVDAMIAQAQTQRGLLRAWHIASNQYPQLVIERQKRFEEAVTKFSGYIDRLNSNELTNVRQTHFNAYALVALCTAIERECAVEPPYTPDKMDGLRDIILDLFGFRPEPTLKMFTPDVAFAS